jgi:hypothetical protein
MTWIHAVVDVPEHAHPGAARFWGAVLGWPLGPPWPGHPELQSFLPEDGATPYVHLQRVEAAARVHLDLERVDVGEAATQAVALGAKLVGEHDRWRTFVSPGGLPFCILETSEHRTPAPIAWPDGHRSRLVQVCIDSPRSVHDEEVVFWSTLLGGRWVDSAAPEFAGKWHDDAGSPLQLLFQRLDAPEGATRAHLDHGTDDLTAEVRRLRGLGAAYVGPGRGWHVLREPSGMFFCVTANSPEVTARRDLG